MDSSGCCAEMFQYANFSIVMAMVLSHLDYSNSLVFECLVSNMAELQHIQNTTAHVVLDTQHPCPTQQLLCHLHWLPVHFHVNYRMSTLTYKVLAHINCSVSVIY